MIVLRSMRWLPLLLCVLGRPLPCLAQVRSILEVPINFQNDTTQGRTLAQLTADGNLLGKRVFTDPSYGAVTVATTVYAYLTVPMDKGCPTSGQSLPPMNMPTFLNAVTAGLAARGQSTAGYTYVYYITPGLFGKCSHGDPYRVGYEYSLDNNEAATYLSWAQGLAMSLNWACRVAAGSGAFVTLSAFCGPSSTTASGRDFTAFTGQGGGINTAADNARLGFLPAAQQTTVPTTTTTGQWTITRYENYAAGLKRLLLPALGIELTYHAAKTSIGWDTRGVTAHLINTSNHLDFAPDNFACVNCSGSGTGSTALEPTASWVYGGLRLTVLSADLDTAVVDLRPSSNSLPTIPSGPRCATTSPDPSVAVPTLIDGTCGAWRLDTVNHRAYRTPGGLLVEQADSLSFCHGTVYVHQTPGAGNWNRYVTGATGASAVVWLNAPATPDCSGVPPPPQAVCADGLDNDGDGKIDLADPGCVSPNDTDETDPVPPPSGDPSNQLPAVGASVQAGHPITMSVDTLATGCWAHWFIGTQDNAKTCVKTATGWKFTETPGSVGTRAYAFHLCWPGLPCVDTPSPPRGITVTP